MSYIFGHFWPYFLGAFGLGLLVGIITWMRNAQGVWQSGWLRWALLLFAAGIIAAFFRLFVGRGGVYLETALWMFGFYIAGCWLGGVLRTLFAAPESRFSGHAPAATTGGSGPGGQASITAASAGASGTPAAFASGGAAGSVAGGPGRAAAGASSEPGSATGPVPGSASLAPPATKGPGGRGSDGTAAGQAGSPGSDHASSGPSARPGETGSSGAVASPGSAGDGTGSLRPAPAKSAGPGGSGGIAAGVATGVAAASGSASGPVKLTGKAAQESSVPVGEGREAGAGQRDAGPPNAGPLDARQVQAGPTGAGPALSSGAGAAGTGTGQISTGEAAPGEAGPDGEIYAGTRPAALAAPRTGKADDLKRIRGIGRQNERKLNDLGIFHFDQIAAWSEDEIEWVGGYLAFPGRIGREDWVGQAGQLARGMETEFSRRVDSGDVPTSQKDG